jgi:NAD(P)H-flavin reductase
VNPYIPYPVTIRKVEVETEDRLIKSFELVFKNKDDEKAFNYMPGQFAELSILGKGESPIGIASSPTEKGFLKFTVMKVGVVTTALHEMTEGAGLGVRGPLGNTYPIEQMRGKDVVIIGGGFAFTTLRSLLAFMLASRGDYGDITVIYGARSPGMLLYQSELAEWKKRSDLNLHLTVDNGDDNWQGRVGFVPQVTKDVAPRSMDAYAIICGPPIMIKFTIPVMEKLGFPPERVYTSLEMRMKCGIGKCGRCNIGPKYVCKDGPVFSLAELGELPGEY